jgi:uncharacterized protein (DUF983 family)
MSDDKPQVKIVLPWPWVGFVTTSTILFVGLKLAGVITWPWVWILSPLWLPTAVVAVLILLAFIGGFLYSLVRKRDV